MNIIDRVKRLGFPSGEYVVIGSGLLDALGLRRAVDLDIAVTKKLADSLHQDKKWRREFKFGVLFYRLDEVEITTKLDFERYSTTTEEAIETAMYIEEVPFLNYQELVKFKCALGREKDYQDIAMLRSAIGGWRAYKKI